MSGSSKAVKSAAGGGILGGAGGAITGGLLGSLGSLGNKGSSTVTTTNSAPAYVQPYAIDYLNRAQSLSQQPYQQSVANFTPDQNMGFGMVRDAATGSQPAAQDANTSLQNTINGNYLTADSNPYLKGAVDSALNNVQGRVNSQFSGNNYGSSGHEEWLGRNLAQTALPIYAQNYQNERNNQLQASMFAPGLANTNIANLENSGAQQQALQQARLDSQLGFPYQQLNTLGNAVQTASGNYGTSTGPNPYQKNTLAALLGGGASGAGLGFLVGGPTGAAVGGGLGALAGGFG